MVKRQDNERGVQVDGMVWYGMYWYGMVWYGTTLQITLRVSPNFQHPGGKKGK